MLLVVVVVVNVARNNHGAHLEYNTIAPPPPSGVTHNRSHATPRLTTSPLGHHLFEEISGLVKVFGWEIRVPADHVLRQQKDGVISIRSQTTKEWILTNKFANEDGTVVSDVADEAVKPLNDTKTFQTSYILFTVNPTSCSFCILNMKKMVP
ncbi:hypothetical protein M8C21_003969 [Ambrosia artemisiifolia]|uniref:Uncharacterized protein n=1 Tax=Ambrosia artemisiifolia TaxID=4212 RepID=A0AAD5GCX1_AMBAR|nr:hypothetical protein M8C21_003969 [Ambrosia artemisiifolia]